MKYYNLVKEFVDQAFTKIGQQEELPHFERTVYWFMQLKPDVDEAFLIAAYAHDVERAFRVETDEDLKNKSFTDDFFLKYHPQKGAEIIGNFLEQQEAPAQLINRVKSLIAAHEIGGDDDQNLLKDADTISFFEDQNKIDWFISRVAIRSMETIKQKFDWMFERITSQKAKELAKPFYEQAMQKIHE